jgi:hypothetical protein
MEVFKKVKSDDVDFLLSFKAKFCFIWDLWGGVLR